VVEVAGLCPLSIKKRGLTTLVAAAGAGHSVGRVTRSHSDNDSVSDGGIDSPLLAHGNTRAHQNQYEQKKLHCRLTNLMWGKDQSDIKQSDNKQSDIKHKVKPIEYREKGTLDISMVSNQYEVKSDSQDKLHSANLQIGINTKSLGNEYNGFA
jgi:hypothetical protein